MDLFFRARGKASFTDERGSANTRLSPPTAHAAVPPVARSEENTAAMGSSLSLSPQEGGDLRAPLSPKEILPEESFQKPSLVKRASMLLSPTAVMRNAKKNTAQTPQALFQSPSLADVRQRLRKSVSAMGAADSIKLSHRHEEKAEANRVQNSDQGYLISPKSRLKMGWDLCLVLPLLVYLAVIMPFRLCYANEPSRGTGIYWFEFTIDLVFIVDIILNFFTGYFVNPDESNGIVEYDVRRIARRYLKSWFILDVVSGIPFGLLEILLSASTGDASTLKLVKSLRLIRFLKLGRLLKVEKIMSSLDRDTMVRFPPT